MGERRMYSMVQRLNTLSTITISNLVCPRHTLLRSCDVFGLNGICFARGNLSRALLRVMLAHRRDSSP